MATAFKEIGDKAFYPLLGPQNIDGGKTGNYVSMKNYKHATIIVVLGATAAASSLTISRAKTVAGGSAESWEGWNYVAVNANYSLYATEDASPTWDLTMTAVSSYTKSTGTTSNQMWIIEFDSAQLDSENAGWDCFTVAFSDPTGSVTNNACVLVMLSEPRYMADPMPSAITN